MTSFKDLLSKHDLSTIKAMADKSKPIIANDKPDSVQLASHQQVQKQVKQLGEHYVDEDKVLFMQAMNGVKPLKHTPTINDTPTNTPKHDLNIAHRRAAAVGGQEDNAPALSDMQALLNPVASEAFLSYKNPTLPTKVFEQLKQGKLRWWQAVDLHGSSIDEARAAIIELINLAQSAGENVVKIVHGKGSDALIKTCVNGWLRQMPSVLAFVSAPSKDGGTGAVLVLLKKNKASKEYE